jgi:hypothetical protein
MFESLHIEGFRTFADYWIRGLTQVNLLVGGNNAGKTSVLEAGEILAIGGAPWVLLRSPTRRGDGFLPTPEARTVRESLSIAHLFHGHDLRPGAFFRIEGHSPERRSFVHCELILADVDTGGSDAGQLTLLDNLDPDLSHDAPLALTIEGHETDRTRTLPLGSGGRLRIPLVSGPQNENEPTVNFVGTAEPEYRLGALWDQILLTPNEEYVVDALRIIEPNIDRVASLSRPSTRGAPSGIVLRLRNSHERIPIGSMGDGLKRLLALTVNLVNSAGGYLFVDEIDTGLHYSVLAPMWRLLIETARRLNVQVFASSHSLDCIQALAHTFEQDRSIAESISVHRVHGTKAATRYSADEIAVAVRQEMEIR